ncbi:putative transcription factor interactor and regulator CCHC(Zn) family [Helianthus annuus]|nr:putative transcription factor interactor and regulator CCHC(Zn) family [Helianthus annuus]
MASPSSSNTNPMFNGLAPMIAIKLTPNNYISWRTQMVPILSIQQLLSHVDGSLTPPTPTILSGEKEITNPSHTSWIRDEQQAIILLNASLSEEVFSITVGLSSAREIWVALEAAFCNASVERVQNLRDNLRALKKGDKSVADFARSFKNICDQLTAIGHPIDAMDQVHWFLCGLGTSFESFSTTTRSVRPIPSFVDLVASAESHELFIKNLHGTLQNDTSNTLAFMAQSSNITNNNNFRQSNFGGSTANSGHQFKSNRSNYNTRSNRTNYNSRFGGQSGNFFRGQNKTNRPPFNNFQRPTCQLCNKHGHSAAQCFHLASFAQSTASPDQLAQAFHAQCQLNATVPDWTSDTGATTHMLPNASPLQNTVPMQGSTNQENASPRMP